jgi:hypothetical protein
LSPNISSATHAGQPRSVRSPHVHSARPSSPAYRVVGVTAKQPVITDADGLRSTGGGAPARRVASLGNKNWVPLPLDLQRATFALSRAEAVVFSELVAESWHVPLRLNGKIDETLEPVRCGLCLAELARNYGFDPKTIQRAKKSLVDMAVASETDEGLLPIMDYRTWINPKTGGPLLSEARLAHCYGALNFAAAAHRKVEKEDRNRGRKSPHRQPDSSFDGDEKVPMPTSEGDEKVPIKVPNGDEKVPFLPPPTNTETNTERNTDGERALTSGDQGEQGSEPDPEASVDDATQSVIEAAAKLAEMSWSPKVASGIRSNIHNLPGDLILKAVKYQHWVVTQTGKEKPETFAYLESIVRSWMASGPPPGAWDNMRDDGSMMPRSEWVTTHAPSKSASTRWAAPYASVPLAILPPPDELAPKGYFDGLMSKSKERQPALIAKGSSR